MKPILHIFILIMLIFAISWAGPLEWHVFSFLSPVCYVYYSADTLFAVSTEGWLVPVAINHLEKGKAEYVKCDSLFLGVQNINWAGWDGTTLHLATATGYYQWHRHGNLVQKSHVVPIMISEHRQNSVAVLFPGKFSVWRNGQRYTANFPVAKSSYYIQLLNDSLLALFTRSGVEIRYISGKLRKRFYLPGWKLHTLWKTFRGNLIYFYPRLCTAMGDTILLSPGYQQADEESESDRSLLLYYDISTNDTVAADTLRGQVIRMWSGNKGWVSISAPFRYARGNMYLINVYTRESIDFQADIDIDLYPFYKEYVLSFSLLNGYTIFTYFHPETRYRSNFKSIYTLNLPFFRMDLNRDGYQDLALLGSSNWLNTEDRVYEIVILENHIEEEKQRIFSNIRRARQYNNFAQCEKAFFLIEKALATSHYLLPDSTETYLKLRNDILQKVQQKRWVHKAFTRIGGYLPILVAVILILLLFINLRRKQDENRSIPSAETLNFLQGEALFHKISTTLDLLVESLQKKNWSQMVAIRSELEGFRKYLLQKKVRYEFLEAPRKWRKFYRQILFQITGVIFFTRVVYLVRRIGLLRIFMIRQIQHRQKSILRLKSEFKNLIEQSKSDVISAALLPAINDVQQKYHHANVIFRTHIQVEFPYRYFPDEIMKFYRAFLAILENAIEAFQDMKDCPPQNHLIQIRADSTLDELTITIQDNARGMPPEVVEKIFTPGFSYGKTGKDRGFGLSGVKEFFNGYGDIQVESQICQGTTFRIKLIFGKLPTGV